MPWNLAKQRTFNLDILRYCCMKNITKTAHEAISTHLWHGWCMEDGYLSMKNNSLYERLGSCDIADPKPWAEDLGEWVKSDDSAIHIHAQEAWWKVLQWKCCHHVTLLITQSNLLCQYFCGHECLTGVYVLNRTMQMSVHVKSYSKIVSSHSQRMIKSFAPYINSTIIISKKVWYSWGYNYNKKCVSEDVKIIHTCKILHKLPTTWYSIKQSHSTTEFSVMNTVLLEEKGAGNSDIQFYVGSKTINKGGYLYINASFPYLHVPKLHKVVRVIL